MLRTAAVLFAVGLGAVVSATAQHLPATARLLAAADLPLRATAARGLLDVLRTRPALPVAVAWAAIAGTHLAEGSEARRVLDEALRRANGNPDADAALATLRIELAELTEMLTFRPRAEAELPLGFPAPQAVGELELRDYPRYRMVRTAMRGGSMGAFWPLFRHIEKNGIAMTTPVQMDWSASGERQRPVQMAFLYGDPSITPSEVAKGVEMVEVPATTVLSIGVIGDDRQDVVEELAQRLHGFLAAHADTYASDGPLRTMGYNSPMVPRDQRYFELQLPIRRLPAGADRPATPSSPAAGT